MGQAPKFTGALAASSGFWHWHTLARAHYHTTCHFGPHNPSFSAEAGDAAGNARPLGGRPMGLVARPAASSQIVLLERCCCRRTARWHSLSLSLSLSVSHSLPYWCPRAVPAGGRDHLGSVTHSKHHPTRTVRLAKRTSTAGLVALWLLVYLCSDE